MIENIHGAAGDEIKNLANSLGGLANKLESISTPLTEAAESFKSESLKTFEGMGDKVNQLGDQMTKKFQNSFETLGKEMATIKFVI